MYLELAASGCLKVTLVTKSTGLSDKEIFEDYLEIWWDDIMKCNQAQKPPPPPLPPHPIHGSKEQFLDMNTKEITINSPVDIIKLQTMHNENKYLVLLNEQLSISDYIKIKQLLKEKKKTNDSIRTSIE